MEYKEVIEHIREICEYFGESGNHTHCPICGWDCHECAEHIASCPENVEKSITAYLAGKEKLTFYKLLKRATKTARDTKEVVFKKLSETLYIHSAGAEFSNNGNKTTFFILDIVPEEIVKIFGFKEGM